jgi:hypothetical protein
MSIFEGDNPLEGSAILLLLLQLVLVVVLSRILTKLLRYIKRSFALLCPFIFIFFPLYL